MSLAGEIINHEGVVEEIVADTITVRILSASACASCQAKGTCNMSEIEEKVFRIPNVGQDVTVGERVNLAISSRTGLKSVFLAYVLPVILLVLGLVVFKLFNLNDGLSALLALVTIALYYFILFLLKGAIEKKFVVRIEKI